MSIEYIPSIEELEYQYGDLSDAYAPQPESKLIGFSIRYDEDTLWAWFNALPNPLPELAPVFRRALRLYIEEFGTGNMLRVSSPPRWGFGDPVRHISFHIRDESSLEWELNQSNTTAAMRAVARWYVENFTATAQDTWGAGPRPPKKPLFDTSPVEALQKQQKAVKTQTAVISAAKSSDQEIIRVRHQLESTNRILVEIKDRLR